MGLMDNQVPDRYEKQPMLAVLENFVLDALGKLEPEKAAVLQQILSKTFGGTDWRKTVREQFGLPGDTATQLKAAWKQRVEEAEQTQVEITPEEFAQSAADDILADMGN